MDATEAKVEMYNIIEKLKTDNLLLEYQINIMTAP